LRFLSSRSVANTAPRHAQRKPGSSPFASLQYTPSGKPVYTHKLFRLPRCRVARYFVVVVLRLRRHGRCSLLGALCRHYPLVVLNSRLYRCNQVTLIHKRFWFPPLSSFVSGASPASRHPYICLYKRDCTRADPESIIGSCNRCTTASM
jgi:hypothetical protein